MRTTTESVVSGISTKSNSQPRLLKLLWITCTTSLIYRYCTNRSRSVLLQTTLVIHTPYQVALNSRCTLLDDMSFPAKRAGSLLGRLLKQVSANALTSTPVTASELGVLGRSIGNVPTKACHFLPCARGIWHAPVRSFASAPEDASAEQYTPTSEDDVEDVRIFYPPSEAFVGNLAPNFQAPGTGMWHPCLHSMDASPLCVLTQSQCC